MRFKVSKWAFISPFPFIFILSSCLLTERIELREAGECPQVSEFQRVAVEGYINNGPNQWVNINGGYESHYPYAQFTFSAEPGIKSEFKAAIVWANQGMNGPRKASRTELVESGDKRIWRIYDASVEEIKPNEKVRITGFMIEPCVVKADKIEKL